MKKSKVWRKSSDLIKPDAIYGASEAMDIALKTANGKPHTVDVAIKLGVDVRKAEQMVRGTVNLPHGTGKTARVIVFAAGVKADEARAAGADEVGGDELVAKVAGGWTGFD